MRQVSVAEAQAKFSELLDEAERGEPVEITRLGKVVARLVATQPARKPVDVDALRALTSTMTFQEESAGEFMRRLRDEERY